MNPEEATAIFTFALVVVGAITAGVLICQSILLRAQVRAAREEFIASHPPRIVVRRFEFYPRQDESIPVAERVPLVEFVVANEGRSVARIVASNVTTKILPVEEMKRLEQGSFPVYEGSINMLQKNMYEPGERQAQDFVLHGIKDVEGAVAGLADGSLQLACFGFIQYEDTLHVKQETRFFRKSNVGERFLVANTDPDYENC